MRKQQALHKHEDALEAILAHKAQILPTFGQSASSPRSRSESPPLDEESIVSELIASEPLLAKSQGSGELSPEEMSELKDKLMQVSQELAAVQRQMLRTADVSYPPPATTPPP